MCLLSITYGILPSELRSRLSSSDFTLLAGYYRINPWGPWRDDLRVGHLTAMTYNINRQPGSKALSAADFVFDSRRAEKEQERNELETLRALDALAARRDKENGD